MKTFQCNAMGDSMCFQAPDLADAKEQLAALCGQFPDGLVSWQELSKLPEGEEYAADVR